MKTVWSEFSETAIRPLAISREQGAELFRQERGRKATPAELTAYLDELHSRARRKQTIAAMVRGASQRRGRP